MASVTWDDVVGIAGNLSGVSELGQTAILAYVNDALEPRNFGGEESPNLYLARILLAAHFGELARRQASGAGVSGPVSSKTIGASSITVQYAAQAMGADGIMSTEWGRQYKDLIGSQIRTRIYLPK